MPATLRARLDHVGDDAQLRLLADRAVGRGLGADVGGRADQFRVGVAHLAERHTAESDLVDEHATGQTVVDDAAARCVPPQGTRRESHAFRVAVGQTCPVNAIKYGTGIPGEPELRLLGDLSGGKRALELGVSNHLNSIAFALAGAKALAVDPDRAAIEQLREAVVKADAEAQHTTGEPVRVECHVSDLADLGFATSGSISAVVASHTLVVVDDLSRVLRQVHRVLRAGHPFVISVPHPFAGVGAGTPYGAAGRTIGDWFTQLARTNFRIDQVLELGVGDTSPVPTTLVLRARKEGD